MNPRNKAAPARVRLAEDYSDPEVDDVRYPAGTVLARTQSGQYVTDGTRLGEPCVAYFFLIRDACEIVES